MEKTQDFQELSNKLNQLIDQQHKDKQQMKSLLLSSSKSSLSRPTNWEKVNIIMCIVCVLYFITRTLFFKDIPLFFWTGVAAILVWGFQGVYSWVGFKKLSAIQMGEESVTTSIEKIVSLLDYYRLQKKAYIASVPFTFAVTLPIPLMEFRKIDLSQLIYTHWGTIIIALAVICLVTILFSFKFYKDNYEGPLDTAKNTLKDLVG